MAAPVTPSADFTDPAARPGYTVSITSRHSRKMPVTDAMYASSIPVFKQMLGGLAATLAKAESHAAEKNIEVTALTQARLFPDMFPMRRQVQIACDFARGISARLAGAEVPKYEDQEQSFAELRGLIQRTLDFIDGFSPAQLEGAAEREIVTSAITWDSIEGNRDEGRGLIS
jgi:hypothetical protein